MGNKSKKIQIILPIVVLLLILGVVIPIPYYIEAPGAAVHLNELVTVNNKLDDEKGSFMLTTVSIRQATPLTYFMRFLPFHEGLSKNDLYGDTTSTREFNNLQDYYMTSSVNSAIELAYKTAGAEYQQNYKGVYVMSVIENSKFKGKLEPGDTIVSLDGNSFKSSQEFIDYVKEKKVGTTIQVVYRRDGKENTVSAPLIKLETDKKAGLGISLVDDTEITTTIPVKVNTDEIGGPSAGLMFSLEIYSQLKGVNLRNGRQIAGTGTITSDGEVGRIGGIDKKVVAADKEGATVFFAPNDTIDPKIKKKYPELKTNYQEAQEAAKKIKTDMKIIPVKTFQDAIDYLEKNK
ncbi:SepM family pheromone-processing serine protease [Carnobacterium gallinarum]|uniref:SepM family pheromone-processing serine protease n=1 Tax=Carnobacterium gallinarum TaxID=2749 RepID=UPI0005591CD0|nr:SepM family pheromone-processing serine protease [Carnobacterium gallinarum]